MSPIFILDNSSAPARYGITASLWANRLGLPLWSLRPDFAGDVPDSHQHVIRAGYCVTSGLWRSDTLREEVRDIARLPSSDAVIVLASSQAPLIADLPGPRAANAGAVPGNAEHDDRSRAPKPGFRIGHSRGSRPR